MSSAQGRFTSPDPKSKSARVTLPQSWNRYVYTLNNPLKYVDPDGMDIILAELSRKEREYAIENLARLYATPTGRQLLERADRSRFTVEIGVGKLERTNLTPARAGETILSGGKTHVTGGVTRYDSVEGDGHKSLVAESGDSPTARPVRVLIDKDQTKEIRKDPARVFAHEIGGHTAEVLDAAESSAGQFIDSVDPKDETRSEAAEQAIEELPNKARDEDRKAIEEMLKRRGR